MTDTKLLRSYLVRKGLTYRQLADDVGISYQAIWNKINNVTPFKSKEIATITEKLELTAEEMQDVFFAKEVDN